MLRDLEDGLISIITPAYKAAGTLGDTVQSVLAQTYGNWEMLIAEDCSPDDTRAVAQQLAAGDPRIRVIAHETNKGPAQARNTAIAAARGRWLAFLDSDDYWLPEKLELTLAHAQSERAPLAFTGFRRISHDGTRTGRFIPVPAQVSYGQLLRNTVIATSTVLVDRRLVGEVVMRQTYYDDFACWLEILRPGRSAFGLNADLMRYRVLEGSVSRDKKRSALKVWKSYREIEHLGVIPAAWNFAHYAMNGLLKYRRF